MFQKFPTFRFMAIVSLSMVTIGLSGALYVNSNLERLRDFTVVEKPKLKLSYLQQTKEKLEFRLRNTSGGRLHIEGAAHTCACTSVKCSKNDLENDEEFTLVVEVDIGTSRGQKPISFSLLYSVPVEREGSPRPPVILGYPLDFAVNIHPDYEIAEQPPCKSADGKQQIALLVTACAAEQVQVLSANSSMPCCTITEITSVDKGKRYEIRISFDRAKYNSDDGQCYIVVRTDSSREPVHHHPMSFHE